MYPTRELSRLAIRKAALRRQVGQERVRCAVAATRVTRPLEWFDRANVLWRQFSPLAQCIAAPLGSLLQRRASSRLQSLLSLVRWAPLALRAAKLLTALARTDFPARPGA